VVEVWKTSHKELHSLYSSETFISVVKSRIRYERYMERNEENKNAYKIYSVNLKAINNMEAI
jgi:hypothetical protein